MLELHCQGALFCTVGVVMLIAHCISLRCENLVKHYNLLAIVTVTALYVLAFYFTRGWVRTLQLQLYSISVYA